MITITSGNLFKEKVDAIVNAVNCVGVAGKGIALQFKKLYPYNFQLYKQACNNHKIKIGKMFITKNLHLHQPKYIINFPTKNHWREESKIEYISKGLDDLADKIQKLNINSIAIPALGCGCGGLEWKQVKNIIKKKLENLDMNIFLFAPMKLKTKKYIQNQMK